MTRTFVFAALSLILTVSISTVETRLAEPQMATSVYCRATPSSPLIFGASELFSVSRRPEPISAHGGECTDLTVSAR